ncbi:DMT family transporter [Acinetobacter johnsonii]|uniref:DMT family transporter n=1 Tax=Acinetobacter johnsonii TaxID=40214 RepID=UPI00244A8710|nr:EamA family transporter [Acinetobacter johnsonii]MDH2047473.1 DMT family transporter [Acinetobacter johnsonii]
MNTQSQWFGALLVIMGAVGWGTLGIASTQLANAGLSNSSVTGLRIVGTFICLLAFLPFLYKVLRTLQFQDIPKLVIQSLLGMLGMTFCYFNAVQQVGPAIAVALLYTAPIWSVVLSFIFLKERITLKSMMLTLVAVSGVACMMLGDNQLNMTGVLFGLASGICYAAYGVIGKDIIDHYSPTFLLFSSMMVSALAIFPFIHFQEIESLVSNIDFNIVIACILLIVFGTLLPFALYTYGLKYLKASQASIYTIFEPLTAVILASLFANVQLSNAQIFGVILIISVSLLNVILGKADLNPEKVYSTH